MKEFQSSSRAVPEHWSVWLRRTNSDKKSIYYVVSTEKEIRE